MYMSMKLNYQRCQQKQWRLVEDLIWHASVYAASLQATSSSFIAQPTDLVQLHVNCEKYFAAFILCDNGQ